MNLAEWLRQFAEAASKHFSVTKLTKLSRQFGVSNSAKIIEGGFQISVPNMVTAGRQTDAFVLACVIKFPPEDEVYRDTPTPGRLFYPEYRRSFRFGAVTSRLSVSVTDIATALKDVAADAMEA
jgi:hypothetical protein